MPTASTARSSRTVRDMAISLVVLLIPLAVVVAVFRLRGGEDVVVVDPASAVAQAQAAGAFPVTAPRGLGEGWRSVSAAFQNGTTLRIGYLTPSGAGAQLIESGENPDDLLIRELGDQTRPTGVVDVGGARWDTYDARRDERALVLKAPERTIVVIGRGQPGELEALAASVGG